MKLVTRLAAFRVVASVLVFFLDYLTSFAFYQKLILEEFLKWNHVRNCFLSRVNYFILILI